MRIQSFRRWGSQDERLLGHSALAGRIRCARGFITYLALATRRQPFYKSLRTICKLVYLGGEDQGAGANCVPSRTFTHAVLSLAPLVQVYVLLRNAGDSLIRGLVLSACVCDVFYVLWLNCGCRAESRNPYPHPAPRCCLFRYRVQHQEYPTVAETAQPERPRFF